MKVLKNNSLTIISIQNKLINPGEHKLNDLNIDENDLNNLINELPGLKILFDKKILQLEDKVDSSKNVNEIIVENIIDNESVIEIENNTPQQEVKAEVNDSKKNKKKK